MRDFPTGGLYVLESLICNPSQAFKDILVYSFPLIAICRWCTEGTISAAAAGNREGYKHVHVYHIFCSGILIAFMWYRVGL